MKDLLQEIEDYYIAEVNYDVFDKIEGNVLPGAQIEIFWEDREETDKGYIFVLPEQNCDEDDVCIHVPKPDNSDGMGDAPEIFIHLYNLLSNDRVEKVIITGGIN